MTIYYDNRTSEKITKEMKDVVKNAAQATLDCENENSKVEISVSFVTNDEIKDLNKEYRNKDKETDVLSFPLSEENPSTGEVMLGDIVISLEKAREQAEEYGHSFEREIGFLTVHSMLHLLGYDHEISAEEEKIMFEKQDFILNKVGLKR